MFGKTYNVLGTLESNLLLKTKGDIKVQSGGSFKDLNVSDKSLPSGTIVMYYGTTAPSGWVICDGSDNTPTLNNTDEIIYIMKR